MDSGLLNLDGCLTIEQILGAKLTKTCDSLTLVIQKIDTEILKIKQDISEIKQQINQL